MSFVVVIKDIIPGYQIREDKDDGEASSYACSVVPCGAPWCPVVPCDELWCPVVLCGALGCSVVLWGALWCSVA